MHNLFHRFYSYLFLESFEITAGIDAFNGLLSSPEQADGTNTFHFGSQDEDETGLEWCEAECRNKAECSTFTFYSNIIPNSDSKADWRGDCLGKTDFDDTWEGWIYATSGVRVPAGTSSWYSQNCGHKMAAVCKKPEGVDAVNPPTTVVQSSYCPDGYSDFGAGSKFFQVLKATELTQIVATYLIRKI